MLQAISNGKGAPFSSTHKCNRAYSTAHHNERRVVVAGLGLVTPLGVNVPSTWDRLVKGDCAVDAIKSFDTSSFPCKIAAVVPRGNELHQFDASKWVPNQAKSAASPFIEFALAAADEALQDSGFKATELEEQERAGVAVGSGIGSLDDIAETSKTLQSQGYKRVSPYFIPRVLVNLAAGHISIKHGLKGPNHAVSTACATGAHAIGDAYRFIKYGDADVMIAGGTEACISPLALAGFCRAKALSTNFNNDPKVASRPFDKDRDGFVMGEGAGILVLEEYHHAIKRGSKIYAEVRGYGLSGDAYHITAPSTDDRSGAYRAMQKALSNAGLKVEDVDYINAHATSTPLGDSVENASIKKLFGQHAYNLKVSSTKGAIGHLLGAAGSVEAIFTILAMNKGIIPPTINLHNKEPAFDLNYVPLTAQQATLNVALSNSFGFGGTNATLVFSKVN